MQTVSRTRAIVALCLISVVVSACAAKGVRNQARVAALTVGEAVLGIDQVQRTLYAQNGYGKDVHDRVSPVVLKALYAARTYERAVAAWPDGAIEPSNVQAARLVLLAVLNDLPPLLPASVTGRQAFVTAVEVARAALVAAGGGQ